MLVLVKHLIVNKWVEHSVGKLGSKAKKSDADRYRAVKPLMNDYYSIKGVHAEIAGLL